MPTSGTIRMRAEFDNPRGTLKSGLFARVRVTGTPSYATLLVPDEAIGTDQTNKYVLVVQDDGMVERRNVKAGGGGRSLSVASCP